MNSPLLRGEIPSPADLAAFLWAVSPGYNPKARWSRKRFFRRCRREFKKSGRAVAVIKAAFEYIANTFADRPGGSSVEGTEYYCDACFICACFAREFGWDDETTLDKPLTRIFQYLKELRRHNNPKAPLFKPSDRIVAAWLEEKNRKVKPAQN